ncbi:hypothetical protein [Halorientalis regularis]|jgi:hypothetical protein|uniref:Uncharacterized protein n=1 Tax=Halorientalis regularis TaxID=660518 RepID=A0A1G7RUC7_9EURY|nr:hypothetical protein [Halorientalis regularis]SDG13779.1 hypothetical protein SAMN05216218_11615 [Halorientalis regularis]
MVRIENPDSCAICGNELPDDPTCVTLPGSFTPAMTPLTEPGIRKIAFCSDRHRQDWLDAKRGEWPEGVEGGTPEEKN